MLTKLYFENEDSFLPRFSQKRWVAVDEIVRDVPDGL